MAHWVERRTEFSYRVRLLLTFSDRVLAHTDS